MLLRSLRTVDVSANTILDPLRLAASVPQALGNPGPLAAQRDLHHGGYVAIPVVTAAAALRVPSLMWEGNLVPGRSVRTTARLTRALAVSFAETCKRAARALLRDRHAHPVLRRARPATAREALDLDAETPVLFVFGGSQAVRRLNRAVADALPTLVGNAYVLHMTGEAGYADALKRARGTRPRIGAARYKPYAFLRAEMTDALLAADLLVGRAGSSTLAEASALGLPMVVVPYPHASSHQMANARALADAGAARIVPDDDFDAAAL